MIELKSARDVLTAQDLEVTLKIDVKTIYIYGTHPLRPHPVEREVRPRGDPGLD